MQLDETQSELEAERAEPPDAREELARLQAQVGGSHPEDESLYLWLRLQRRSVPAVGEAGKLAGAPKRPMHRRGQSGQKNRRIRKTNLMWRPSCRNLLGVSNNAQRQTKCLMAKKSKDSQSYAQDCPGAGGGGARAHLQRLRLVPGQRRQQGEQHYRWKLCHCGCGGGEWEEAGSPTRIDAESSYTLTAKSSETLYGYLAKEWLLSPRGYCRIESGGQSWYAIPDSDSFQFIIYPSDPPPPPIPSLPIGVAGFNSGTQILADGSIGTPPDQSELPAEESPDTDSGQTPGQQHARRRQPGWGRYPGSRRQRSAAAR